MRHQHLLIRRLGLLLRSRMTKAGHLAAVVPQESRGNCLPPRAGCGKACVEARELLALTEPFMAETRDLPKTSKPLRVLVLKRPAPKRRAHREPAQQLDLLPEAI